MKGLGANRSESFFVSQFRLVRQTSDWRSNYVNCRSNDNHAGGSSEQDARKMQRLQDVYSPLFSAPSLSMRASIRLTAGSRRAGLISVAR